MIKAIIRTGGRWAVSWMCVGLVIGLWLVVAKVSVGEPGSASPTTGFGPWLPILGAIGAVFGFVLGLIYAALMVAARPLHAKAGTATWAARNLPRLTSGFIAGAVTGSWAGPESAVMFGALGIISAALSKFDAGLSR
jgi:hypothetical protein